MTSIFSVNESNDIFTIGGRFAISRDIEAVRVHAERVVKAVLGEMIYAQNRGVNYFDSLFNGAPNVLSFEASVRAQLRRVPGLTSVNNFTVDVQDNTASYQAGIVTEFGETVISGNL